MAIIALRATSSMAAASGTAFIGSLAGLRTADLGTLPVPFKDEGSRSLQAAVNMPA